MCLSHGHACASRCNCSLHHGTYAQTNHQTFLHCLPRVPPMSLRPVTKHHRKLMHLSLPSKLGLAKTICMMKGLMPPSCRANMVADLTNTNANLTAENARLNDRMAKLVKDLTEENKQLLGENQRLNQTVKKVCHDVIVEQRCAWQPYCGLCCFRVAARVLVPMIFTMLQLTLVANVAHMFLSCMMTLAWTMTCTCVQQSAP